MIDNKLQKKKNELMQPDWTENLHHSLEEMNSEDAKIIVESMSNSEIVRKVNNRRFQQDYIADYLQYLWKISEPAFWKHVKTSFYAEEGMLWSDNMFYAERLCNEHIPSDVLIEILVLIKNNSCSEITGCIIKAQVEKFNRLEEILDYISKLEKSTQSEFRASIDEMISSECGYTFE